MKNLFLPDGRFATFDEVGADFLAEEGIRALILDIDNTLEPYENDLPGERVLRWLDELHAAGIRTAIVSNNNRERVERFNESLGMPVFWKAKKPFSGAVKKALAALGARPQEAAFLGDQIFTDVLAGHLASMRAYLVPPIRDRRDLLTRAKRLLERPILARYERKKRKKEKAEEKHG